MRKFETGGTRDSDTDKIDYEGFLSYPVLVAFGKLFKKSTFISIYICTR